MFTREQASRTRQEFWTTFGKYMSPVPSAEGTPVSWVNYHTGVKHIYFRMDAGLTAAVIYISLEHPDAAIRKSHYGQLLKSKTIFHSTLGEKWKWQPNLITDGKEVARVSKVLADKSVMNKDQWPDLISFFKPRIIALDAFWEDAKYGF